RYRNAFATLPAAGITAPAVPHSKFEHVYNQFTIRSNARNELRQFLQDKGIPTEIYYPLCLHCQRAFSYLGYKTGDIPVAEKASNEVLSLPVYAELSEAQQDRIIQGILDFHSQR